MSLFAKQETWTQGARFIRRGEGGLTDPANGISGYLSTHNVSAAGVEMEQTSEVLAAEMQFFVPKRDIPVPL